MCKAHEVFKEKILNYQKEMVKRKLILLLFVNVSLSVYHKLAFLLKDYIKAKGKYLENFFQGARNNKVSNYNSIRMLRSVFYRVINMVRG